jgi:membrane protein YqaA with SNARE-associated domain
MIGWLFVTLGVAFGSALVPLVSVEVFVVGLVSSRHDLPWLAVGGAVAAGQMAGKLPYYLAARGSMRLPRLLHDRLHRERPLTPRRQRWQLRTKHLRSRVEGLRERCHRHPAWMTGTYGASSLVGIPPFMATTVLAGVVRMRMSTFVGAGLAGRLVRFSALAASPTLFAGWFHHL